MVLPVPGMMISSHICSFFIKNTFIFLTFASYSSLVHVHGVAEKDRDSLLAFKAKITNDPLTILTSWNDSLHFCQWHGVTCSTRHPQRVTVLDLQSQKLEGTLSPHIGNLSFLRTLNLQNNSFNRDIPQQLGSLFRLQNLFLENNSFGGEIPANISRCSNLLYLGLGGNSLGGQLPTELGSLSKLRVLNMYSNNLVGEIPTSFGNLSSLERISATLNNLHGSIPSTFGKLKRLTSLVFGANQLSGTIPPSIFNLSSLTLLSLPVNQVRGSLPRDLGLTLPKLKKLNIHTNQLSGNIPVSLSNASNLLIVSLSSNNFSGKVTSFASLRDLQELAIDENNLGNGEDDDLDFLSSLLNCSNLEVLVLSDNNFGGLMPEFVSNFSTKIRIMGWGRNKIRGSIPTEIGNLINLEALGFETNQLTGVIPSSVGKLKYLNDLFFNGNQLSGSIPSSLGNLTSLGRFNMRLNNLEGSIPSSLGQCQNMLSMALSQNKLSGTIPKEVLSISSLSMYVVLSENRLTGSLPLEVGKLVNLGFLDVSENNLSGKIPESLGSCTSLEGLSMGGNFFQGTIPASLSSLRGLESMDLSRNNLSGLIPEYLKGLTVLQNLNLSFNDFEGEVPVQGVFKNASGISVVGNKKLCGGIPELNLSICSTSEGSKKQGMSFKLKLIISLVSGVLGLVIILITSFLFLYRSRKNRKMPPLGSSMGSFILKVSYQDLVKATNGFSSDNLIGVGGFGSVYKGILFGQEQSVVAVKVLHLQERRASKSFKAECEALRSIRHRNLVKLLTTCSSVDFQGNDFKALIYEFMINGSLEDWLHPVYEEEPEHRHLNFLQRINIAIDVVSALDYLHNDCQVTIVHCDLKPSNILLTSDMTACVGDFGLARIFPDATHHQYFSSNQTSSLGIKGSIGYAAPEYGMGSEVSTFGDVYSYGILLLEMFTGKRPTDDMFKDGLNLHNYAMMALPERVVEIGDPKLFEIYSEEKNAETTYNMSQVTSENIRDCLTSVVKIGVACSAESPRERMNIRNVAAELNLIRANLLGVGVHEEHHHITVKY